MALPKKVREQVHKKYNGKCAYCGIDITYKQMQVDHAIPQSCFQGHVLNKLHIPPHLTHLGEWECNPYRQPKCQHAEFATYGSLHILFSVLDLRLRSR
jgi:hypothetical protein